MQPSPSGLKCHCGSSRIQRWSNYSEDPFPAELGEVVFEAFVALEDEKVNLTTGILLERGLPLNDAEALKYALSPATGPLMKVLLGKVLDISFVRQDGGLESVDARG